MDQSTAYKCKRPSGTAKFFTTPPAAVRIGKTCSSHNPTYNKYNTPGKITCINKNYWIEGIKLHQLIRNY